MKTIILKLPFSSSAFMNGISFRDLPNRGTSFDFSYENELGEFVSGCIVFAGAVSIRITYFPAITGEMIVDSYDRIVDMGMTRELIEVSAAISKNGKRELSLKHYRVCFDDGPCLDIICMKFELKAF